MVRKRGKMFQSVKNGTQYKKCTLASSAENPFIPKSNPHFIRGQDNG